MVQDEDRLCVQYQQMNGGRAAVDAFTMRCVTLTESREEAFEYRKIA